VEEAEAGEALTCHIHQDDRTKEEEGAYRIHLGQTEEHPKSFWAQVGQKDLPIHGGPKNHGEQEQSFEEAERVHQW
jgi:hypothetical protein